MATVPVLRTRRGPVAVIASVAALILTFVSATPAHVVAALCETVAVAVMVATWRRSTAPTDRRLYRVAVVVIATTLALWGIAFVAFHALTAKG